MLRAEEIPCVGCGGSQLANGVQERRLSFQSRWKAINLGIIGPRKVSQCWVGAQCRHGKVVDSEGDLPLMTSTAPILEPLQQRPPLTHR